MSGSREEGATDERRRRIAHLEEVPNAGTLPPAVKILRSDYNFLLRTAKSALFEQPQGRVEGIYEAIRQERHRQDEKWGTSFPDRDWDRWVTILTEEVGEFAEAVLEMPYRDDGEQSVRRELVQVAAVAVSALTFGAPQGSGRGAGGDGIQDTPDPPEGEDEGRPTVHRTDGGGCVWTDCPKCGPDVSVDEEVCCVGCGRDATHYGVMARDTPDQPEEGVGDLAQALKESARREDVMVRYLMGALSKVGRMVGDAHPEHEIRDFVNESLTAAKDRQPLVDESAFRLRSRPEGEEDFKKSAGHPSTEFGECTACGEVFGRAAGERWVQCRDCRNPDQPEEIVAEDGIDRLLRISHDTEGGTRPATTYDWLWLMEMACKGVRARSREGERELIESIKMVADNGLRNLKKARCHSVEGAKFEARDKLDFIAKTARRLHDSEGETDGG